MAVVVIDRDLRVRTWNEGARSLWGLRAEDVEGENFVGLDIGLPVHELRDLLRSCVTGDVKRGEKVLPGHDRKGKSVRHEVMCVSLDGADGHPGGAIIVVDGKDSTKL
jgi:two-component system CheB/CheR fusion protein